MNGLSAFGEVQSDPLAALAERVAAIEARQRAAGMHDPDCAETVVDNTRGLDGLRARLDVSCTCWLSRESA